MALKKGGSGGCKAAGEYEKESMQKVTVLLDDLRISGSCDGFMLEL